MLNGDTEPNQRIQELEAEIKRLKEHIDQWAPPSIDLKLLGAKLAIAFASNDDGEALAALKIAREMLLAAGIDAAPIAKVLVAAIRALRIPPSKAQSEIKRLKERNRELSIRSRHYERAAYARVHGEMDQDTFRPIAKVLHPDSQPTITERNTAMAAFNAWIDSRKRAARR